MRRLGIEERADVLANAFAHGEVVVDSSSLIATLIYREGERKSLVIDEETTSSILNEAMLSFQWISRLNQKAKGSASEL